MIRWMCFFFWHARLALIISASARRLATLTVR